MTNAQRILTTGLLLAVTGSAVFQARQTRLLRAEVRALRADHATSIVETARLGLENEQLRTEATRSRELLADARDRRTELLRLRAELGVLKQQRRELARLAAARETSVAANPGAPATTSPPPLPPGPAPFQLRLVMGQDAPDTELLTNAPAGAAGETAETVAVAKDALLDHTSIQSAQVLVDPASGSPSIEINFTDQGRDAFARVTRENLDRRLAITLDGKLYAAPVIRSEITGGKAVVSGKFTEEQAWELAAKINLALRP